MNLAMSNGICSNCKGTDKCGRSCILHTGQALVSYINNIDTIPTKIGEYSSKGRNASPDLIVSGHQVSDLTSPTWILTDLSTKLDITPKFQEAFGKNAIQIVREYMKFLSNNIDDNDKEASEKHQFLKEQTDILVDKIQKINKNKLVILPLKPSAECKIDIVDDKEKTDINKVKNLSAKIKFLKWTTNKENFKLDCQVNFEYENSSTKQKISYNLSDYMSKFILSSTINFTKVEKYDKQIIKMSNYGIISPIMIKSDKASYAIDGTYLYYITKESTSIVGYWDASCKLIENTGIVKNKAYNKLKENINMIKNHKKYIAPYILYPSNILEV